MKAELLFAQRIDYDDGAIVEMVLWRVPSAVPPSNTTMNAAKAITGTSMVWRQPMRSLRSSN
jgi:hypothetical protein